MTDIQFNTYYRYEAITQFLRDWAEQYPHLCRLEAIGQSYEGRDIWLLIVTNFETGDDTDKPAFWVDGNIHATEVAPSSAGLYLIHKLLTSYGEDEKVTLALDSRAFYIVPRLNPDGAEWALADTPKYIRSSTKAYPRPDKLDGLHQEDIDGDGRILQMRLEDSNGNWKAHPNHPRWLIPRQPDEFGGTYYRILAESTVQNYDGAIIKQAPPHQGLDLNRQFPVFWEPNERGAGQYPGSEPEPHAAMRFIADHPNITGAISYHTYSGVHLRPPTREPEDKMNTQDLRTYKKIGQVGTDLTGYPAISVYHNFKYDPKQFIRGTFDDWMYEHLGVYAWTTEIWNIQRMAGIDVGEKPLDWFLSHPAEDMDKLIEWVEENLSDAEYVDWYEFDHPQLGKVELGGWNFFLTWRNPPYKFLEAEIAPLADFALFHCLISPKLGWHSVTAEKHGETYFIRAVVQNEGWLPTNVTEQALKQNVVRQVELDISLPDGTALVAGDPKVMVGQLAGRDDKSVIDLWGGDATADRAKAEWVIKGSAGDIVVVTAVHPRAGRITHEITLS